MSGVKLPLAARKSIRDDFDPYVPQFEKDMEGLLGTKWTLEMPWNECLDTAEEGSGFKRNPGRFAANYFQAAVTQLKTLTQDGKDDMVIEAINEAADKHIITILIDDKINSYSDCRIEDGKLCLVFKAKTYFGSNINETLSRLMSIL